MNSLGSILRQERERQGRPIAEIATELCVTQRYLQAIEMDDVAGIPGLFFYKNFARQYAAVLGVDPELIRPELNAIQEPGDAPPRPEIRVPDHLVQAANRQQVPDVPLGLSVVALVAVLLGCSGVYAWWNRMPQRLALPAAAIQKNTPVMILKAAASISPPAANPAEPPTITSSADPSSAEVTGVVLNLSATERTWLSINSGGKEIFEGVLQASESKTLTGLEHATMKVGNAAGIEVRLNGKPIGPLGMRGQVLTIRFTPEDFEILPPKQEL